MNAQREFGPLPAREDINVYDSLDERCACDHFLGKNLDQAEVLFRTDFLRYHDDLLSMGPCAFRYYVHAVMRYLSSAESSGDSDAASTFASVLDFRLEHEREEMRSVAPALAECCKHLVDNISRFECDPAIYGDVRARYSALISALEQLANPQS